MPQNLYPYSYPGRRSYSQKVNDELPVIVLSGAIPVGRNELTS